MAFFDWFRKEKNEISPEEFRVLQEEYRAKKKIFIEKMTQTDLSDEERKTLVKDFLFDEKEFVRVRTILWGELPFKKTSIDLDEKD